VAVKTNPLRPLRVTICGREYPVDWDAREETELARGSFAGRSNEDKGFIAINDTGILNDDARRDTMLHEVVHLVLGLTALDSEGDEKFVRVFATHLLDTFRRNPHLVKFLMDGAG
jgi:hypothetical protein